MYTITISSDLAVIILTYFCIVSCGLLDKMAKRPHYSDDGNEFDLLSVENQDKTVKRIFFKEYQDLTPSDSERYNFTVPSNELGTDLSNCYVEVQLRVVKENGQSLTESDREKIQPTHDFFDALFASVEVLVNGVAVGDIGTFHPLTALMHNLLDHDEQFQVDSLKLSNIWYKDYDYPATFPQIRHKYIAKSKVLQLYGRLNHNVFTSKRLLPPQTSIQITMRRTSDEYCLIRAPEVVEKYKIVIDSCKLHVRRILFHDSVVKQLDKYPKKYSAVFPYTQTSMNRFQIPIGSTMNRSLNTHWGQMPKHAFFTICESESIDGNNWENNPMIFPASQYHVNHIQFYTEDDDPILQKPYKPDFDNGNANRAYNQFLQVSTNGFTNDRNPGLTCDDFNGQYGIFGIDKMPGNSQMSCQVGFSQATPRNLYGLLFIQRDAYFTIDGFGGVKNTP